MYYLTSHNQPHQPHQPHPPTVITRWWDAAHKLIQLHSIGVNWFHTADHLLNGSNNDRDHSSMYLFNG